MQNAKNIFFVAFTQTESHPSRVAFLFGWDIGEEKPGASCKQHFVFDFFGATCRPRIARAGFRIPVPQPTKNALLSIDKGAFFE